MKIIKWHLPTQDFGFVEVEFDSMEEMKKEYSNVYVGVKTLQKKAEQDLHKLNQPDPRDLPFSGDEFKK
jgi:hypothetical protein